MAPNQSGANAERELVETAWETYNYATLRAPGSGSIDRPSPDVVLIKADYDRDYGVYKKVDYRHILAIELKNNADGTAYFDKCEIEELDEWANRAGADAYIGVKPDLRRSEFDTWYFLRTENLHKTDNGYSLRKQDHAKCETLSQILIA